MTALKGIKVIDLSRVLAGPFCTMLLGDLGADVIKIEAPGGSDETREWGPPFVGDQSAYYMTFNRNKRAMTLNLKDADARQILREMLVTADVLVQNFKTGTMEKWGLGYEQVRSLNPRLVYCSISGFGQSGPYKNLPGYDIIAQAMGGFMSINGTEASGPLKSGIPIADLVTGLYSTIGILAALHDRSHTGEGQHVDMSLLDSMISMLGNVASNYFVTGNLPKRYGNQHPNIVPYQAFTANDGEMVVTVGNDRQFQQLCEVIGKGELAENEEFATNRSRITNRETLIELLQAEFSKKTIAEWQGLLKTVGIPSAPINNLQQVFSDPHVNDRQMRVTIPHPELGSVDVLGTPLKLSRSAVEIKRHPPLVGEHTEEILKEYGLTSRS